MACMTTEKSPLAQKRCSLPGSVGSLNLYAAHQQRRLSERGLMIYRPNKPDIDLIRDFTTTNQRKNSTPSFSFHQNPPGSSGQFSGGLQYAHSSSGSLSCLNRNFHCAGPSSSFSASSSLPSTSTHSYRRASFSPSSSSSDPNPYSASCGSYGVGGAFHSGSCNTNSNSNGNGGCSNNAKPPGSTITGASGCRKVRLRIQKNAGGAKEKYVELQQTDGSLDSPNRDSDFQGQDSGSGSEDSSSGAAGSGSFMRNPLFDARRFSDSVACRPPPAISISITPDFGNNGNSGIVCSTGDLLTLKCLTSSAQEIRYYSSPYGTDSDAGASSPRILVKGNRSKSFDATFTHSLKGAASSWFNRRHLPMSVKLPLPMPSPVVPVSPNSPQTQMFSFHQNQQGQSNNKGQPQLRTPILTVTNEDAVQSELIEIPSPPAVTPVSSGSSPGERTTVPWGRNGFVLDAAALGFAIENHLRKADMKRRATFSTLYEAPPSSMELKVTTRARSASACVIVVPKEILQAKAGTGRRESITTDTRALPSALAKQATSRRSSLKCTPTRFPWEKSDKGNEPSPLSRDRSMSVTGAPIDYSGSFTRTTTEFTDDCIDEEDDVVGTPINCGGASKDRSPNNTKTSTVTFTSTSLTSTGNTSTAVSTGSLRKNSVSGRLCSRTPSSGSLSGRRRASSALTDGASMPLLPSGSSEEGSSPSAATTTKKTSESSGNGMSICGAIRDFILHSMR